MKNLIFLFASIFTISLHAQTASISGTVSNREGDLLPNLEVNIENESGDISMSLLTDANGAFTFSGLPTLDTYTLHCDYGTNYLGGVSTLDLVRIAQHVLGIDPITDIYAMIAADVNLSGTITTLDLVLIKKLILAIDTEFPNTDPWRFFYDGNPPVSTDATPIPLTGDVSGLEIIGVKMGDVLD